MPCRADRVTLAPFTVESFTEISFSWFRWYTVSATFISIPPREPLPPFSSASFSSVLFTVRAPLAASSVELFCT